MKIFLKTEDEISLMRKANQLVGATLAELGKHIQPGVTTLQLDKIAEEFIRDYGATPTFKNFLILLEGLSRLQSALPLMTLSFMEFQVTRLC